MNTINAVPELDVQDHVVAYLKASGWHVTREAKIGETGADILAERADGQRLTVEVKGWPRTTDRTPASTQAGHWFKDALVTVIMRGPATQLAIALPDMPRYRNLLASTKWALETLNIIVYLVDSTGAVQIWTEASDK